MAHAFGRWGHALAFCFTTVFVATTEKQLAATCEVLGDPSPGTVVAGKYRVEARIAVGGMATILRAQHVGLGEHVALKILLPKYRKSEEFTTRFRREARAAARLRSVHVARVLDYGTLEDGSPFLAMELLEGQDLEARVLERGPLSQREAVDVVLQACEALAEAHALGIVHRDLKPQNLFLTTAADGSHVVKVIDFGIAKTLGGRAGMTSKHSSMGTPYYMSPEQLRATDLVDARSDIWSLGVILHELMTGKNAFDAPNVSELLVRVATSDPTLSFLPHHSAGVVSAVRRCLIRNRDERFASMRDFAKAIAPFGSEPTRDRVERLRRVEEAARARGTVVLDDEPAPRFDAPSIREPASSVPTMAATQGIVTPESSKLRRVAAVAVGVVFAGLLVGFGPREVARATVPSSATREHAPAASPKVVPTPSVPTVATVAPAHVHPSPPVTPPPQPTTPRARPTPSPARTPAPVKSPSPATNDRDRFFNSRK